MSLGKILSGMQISSSGLRAERMQMEVMAHDIANAHSTRTPEGGPYKRQQVTFAAAMNHVGGPDRGLRIGDFGGVQVMGVTDDDSPHPRVYDPGHPDADENGFVLMPNVTLPHEMVDLVTASRAYEANLKSMETFKEMAEQALALLQNLR